MQIYIDFNNILQAIQGNPFKVYTKLFMEGGWLILLISLIWGFYFAFIYLQKIKFTKNIKYTLYAIDVPKDNEKSVQAIEELFNTLHGIISTKTEWEKKITGKMQLWFGLEIISIEGYIQFLIRTPAKYNELVKSAIYAQYPDAELTEVEDYMSLIPLDADHEDSKYGGWGMDWYLGEPGYLPLKTYPSFENSLTQSFIDPMASLLEVMSKLSPGEFIGIMMMIQPIKDRQTSIVKDGQKEIDKLMGREVKSKETILDKGFNVFIKGVDMASEAIYSLWGDIEDSQDDKVMLRMLTPGERAKITAIETKCGKTKYRVRMKSCYIAPKEKYSGARGYNGIQGSFKQFDDFNRLKAVKTKAKYFSTKKRKYWKVKRFLRRYTERNFLETKSFVLGVDELATMYHFPQMDVMAPLIKKAETKTVEPPTGLPLEEKLESELFNDSQKREIDQKLQDNEVIDLDLNNKYFESKFAKDKDKKEDFKKEFEEENKKVPNNLPIQNKNLKEDEKKKQSIVRSTHDHGAQSEPPANLPFID